MTAPTTMHHLPQDVMMLIFKELPEKDRNAAGCVSKKWHQYISVIKAPKAQVEQTYFRGRRVSNAHVEQMGVFYKKLAPKGAVSARHTNLLEAAVKL